MSSISVNIQALFRGFKRSKRNVSASQQPSSYRQRRQTSKPHQKVAELKVEADDLTIANELLQQEVCKLQQEKETLQDLNQKLSLRNEELGAFARTLAHNLKTPLNIVVGMSEILKRDYRPAPLAGPDQADIEECIEVIARNGRWANDTIESILLLTQWEQQEVKTAPLDMAGIVSQAQARLAHLANLSRSQIIGPEAWPLAMGYGPWVEEIWMNYLSNAIKYGGRPPHIEVGAGPGEAGMVRFWVKDNGAGLSLEEQEKLFAPFTRLAGKEIEGTGLGLSIVKGIVTKLGGQVGLESRVGQGSTFYFTLPVCPMDETIVRDF